MDVFIVKVSRIGRSLDELIFQVYGSFYMYHATSMYWNKLIFTVYVFEFYHLRQAKDIHVNSVYEVK